MLQAKAEFIEYPEYKDLFRKLPHQAQRICNEQHGVVSGSAVRYLIEKREKIWIDREKQWWPRDINIYINKKFLIASMIPKKLRMHGVVDAVSSYYDFWDVEAVKSRFRPDHSRSHVRIYEHEAGERIDTVYTWPVYYQRKTTRCHFEDSQIYDQGEWDNNTNLQVLLHDDLNPFECFDCVGNMVFVAKDHCVGHPDAKELITSNAMGWVVRPIKYYELGDVQPRMERYSYRLFPGRYFSCRWMSDFYLFMILPVDIICHNGALIWSDEERAINTQAINTFLSRELSRREAIEYDRIASVCQLYFINDWNRNRIDLGFEMETVYTTLW